MTSETTSEPSTIYHHDVDPAHGLMEVQWEDPKTIFFDEMLISWNADRPKKGYYTISASVKMDEIWSPWGMYALWGKDAQKGGKMAVRSSIVDINQDILQIINGHYANGFKILIKPHQGATLSDFRDLHVCLSRLKELRAGPSIKASSSINLDVPLRSQLKLNHPRCGHMCSPTSTSAVVDFLKKNTIIDPLNFALNVYDGLHDIFGNWTLNVAEAAAMLGKSWRCWAQRLKGFDDIYSRLKTGTPVVVSVKGPLIGSPKPYTQGHLIVVKGFEAEAQQVICMDPAFSEDEKTEVKYALNDFMEAWARRQFIAYIFEKLPETHLSKRLSSHKYPCSLSAHPKNPI